MTSCMYSFYFWLTVMMEFLQKVTPEIRTLDSHNYLWNEDTSFDEDAHCMNILTCDHQPSFLSPSFPVHFYH